MKLKIIKEKFYIDKQNQKATYVGDENFSGFYDQKTGNPVSADVVEIEKISWTPQSCQVIYALGGYGSGGAFQRHPDYKPLTYTFYKELHTQEMWTKYNLDDGPPSKDTVKAMLLEETPAFATVARIGWVGKNSDRLRVSLVQG